jgi:hypothetical protein
VSAVPTVSVVHEGMAFYVCITRTDEDGGGVRIRIAERQSPGRADALATYLRLALDDAYRAGREVAA